MKFTIKALFASVILGAGFFFTSCNNAEPDIAEKDSYIAKTVSVGEQVALGETSYQCNNNFVGEVVDNLTLSTGKYGFRALHVGTCTVKNSNREYRFTVTSSNNTIEPVLDWDITAEELVETLGESSCKVEGNTVTFSTGAQKPVNNYVYTFADGKLNNIALTYIYDSNNPLEVIEGYFADRFNKTEKVENDVTITVYYNAESLDKATTVATSVAEELEGSIAGTKDTALNINFYSAAAYAAL